jgi:hypothetical protein
MIRAFSTIPPRRPVKIRPRWLSRGLVSLYLMQHESCGNGGWRRNQVTRGDGGGVVGSGIIQMHDHILTRNTTTDYVSVALGVNIRTSPHTLICGARVLSGSAITVLRTDDPAWWGYTGFSGSVGTTNNNDFSGSVTPAGQQRRDDVFFSAASLVGANDLRVAVNGGMGVDTSVAALSAGNITLAHFGASVKLAVDNPGLARVYYFGAFNQVLTDNERLELSISPYETLFEPTPKITYFTAVQSPLLLRLQSEGLYAGSPY